MSRSVAGGVAAGHPTPRLSAEARKASFLDAAAALIRDRGLEGMTMEGLAAWCGVNKALPYRHFANRDDVLVALYQREVKDFDTRLQASLGNAGDFEAALRAMVYCWYDDIRCGTGTPELMQARTHDGALEAQRQARLQAAAAYIADLIQASYPVERNQATLAANVLLAGSRGLAATWQVADLDHAALIEAFISMSLAAVQEVADQHAAG